MKETILSDFDEILSEGMAVSITLTAPDKTPYTVTAMVEPVRFSADAVPGGLRPRAAFAATVKRKDLKSLPVWGSPVIFDGKSYSVLNVNHSPSIPLVSIDFCER